MVSLRLLAVCLIALVVLSSCGSDEYRKARNEYREPRCGKDAKHEDSQYNDAEDIRSALAGLRRYPRFRLYSLGREPSGLPPLTSVGSACVPPAYEPAIYPPDRGPPPISPRVAFTYGTCELEPVGEGRSSCSPPLQVENFEVCAVSPHSTRIPPRALTRRIRGAPYLTGDFNRVTLFTGTTTIDIYGDSRDLVMRAVAQLHSVDGRIGPESKLPQPVPGALAGRLRCRR